MAPQLSRMWGGGQWVYEINMSVGQLLDVAAVALRLLWFIHLNSEKFCRTLQAKMNPKEKLMRNFFQVVLVATSLFLTHASVANAQGPAGFDISANGGITNLEGVDQKTGHGAFGFAGGYNLTKHLALGAEYNYFLLGSLNEAGLTGNENLQMYGAFARFSLIVTRFVAPYIVLGGGIDRVKASASGDLSSSSDDETGGYFSFGVGASLYVYRGFGIRPEFRFDRLEYASTSTDSVGETDGGQNEIRVTVGLFYQFGGH
jgi:opacity protein-like surface antigen